ncbi:MAG: PspA/IM30 family protein [Armatimonadota bacterium]
MGILTRLRRIISADVNHLIDRAENPEKVAKQLIREMEDSLREAKGATANAIANLKKLERKQAENAAEAQKWENRAALAVEKGDDDLAREALRRKRIYADLARNFAEQVASQQKSVDTLKASLEALRNKLEQAKARAKVIIARAQRAKAAKSVQRAVAKTTDVGAFEAFERLAERVADDEVEAAAVAELDVDSLEERFRRDEEDAEIEFELQSLKARVAPAAKPESNSDAKAGSS